jgi:transposase
MKPTDWPAWWRISKAVHNGGVFDHSDELTERLRQGPGTEAQQEVGLSDQMPAPTRWTLRTIRASFPWLGGYSLSGVWRVLRSYDLRLRTARIQQYSPDANYISKVARLEQCLREAVAQRDEVVVVFLDEMGYYRWPVPTRSWGAKAPIPAPLAERAGPNNKQWRLIGALNALTGQVDYLDAYILGRAKVVEFYRQLLAAKPLARRIYVVQDNWSIHTHADVLTALAELPQIEPVWLPTYAPWLKWIEKLWRLKREAILKLHRLAGDWATLRERVNAFLDQFALGSQALLRYVGLLGDGKLAQAIYGT